MKDGNDKLKSHKAASTLGLTDLEDLLGLLRTHDVYEFELDRGGEKLKLKRGSQPTITQQSVTSTAQPAVASPQNISHQNVNPSATNGLESKGPAAKPTKAEKSSEYKEVRSPMVGTFYRRPAPDAKPYVEVGNFVKKGEVLCIVEAMKLMNEIESDVTGKVMEVCLDDGQMVEFNEALFRIEPA
ncbi:acetyl-CoA carboxylase biotin carboxyl carrier protein [bacterium]|nr:acetyl-CoA carboxylase biotin carboxyl carrier protein [bacterium]